MSYLSLKTGKRVASQVVSLCQFLNLEKDFIKMICTFFAPFSKKVFKVLNNFSIHIKILVDYMHMPKLLVFFTNKLTL